MPAHVPHRGCPRRGFSLVELSIVLVILGLLTGGILTGQSLIRAAELRSITTDFQRYQAATNTFRGKYMGVPGDLRTATRFWGDNNSLCPDAAIANGTPGTCNGNGNGNIDFYDEGLLFWQHLALAGLVEGSYSGTAADASGRPVVILGENVPRGRVGNSGFFPLYIHANSSAYFEFGYTNGETTLRNYMMFGGAVSNDYPSAAALKPEEAWNIDVKMDDGLPAIGIIKAGQPNGTAGCSTNATISSTYNLALTGTLCRLGMVFL